MARTTSAYDLELTGTLNDGTAIDLGLMLERPTDSTGKIIPGAPKTVAEQLASESSDSAISYDLSAQVQEDWSRGYGLDYNLAQCVETEIPGYAFPAGLATAVSLVLSVHNTNSPIVAFAEFRGDLYVAQQGENAAGPPTRYGRVLKITGGTGAATEDMVISITAGCALTGASAFIRDMVVADDGSGNQALFVSASDVNGNNGVIYRRDTAGVWTNSTTVFGGCGTNGRNRMSIEFMQTPDGNAAWRIVTISGERVISYTLPNADPRDDTPAWVEGVKIGTSGTLVDIAAARRHFWLGATDNLYDVDEMVNSTALTNYRQRTQSAPICVLYMQGYVYIGGQRGLDRVRVDQGDVLQEIPGACTPGLGTPVENDAHGAITAMCEDQGRIVVAMYNPTKQQSYIFWGVDRTIVGIDSPNPLIWHGPKVVYGVDYKVTRMTTSGLAGDLRLWLGSQSVGGSTPRLDWVSLPVVGSSLQDLISGGSHRFATGTTGAPVVQPACILESLQDTWSDKAQKKILYQHDVGTRGTVDDTVKITFSTRADPNPAGTSPAFTPITPNVHTPPMQTLVPVATVQGNKTQWRAEFNSNSTTAPPILDSVRTLAWKIAPSLPVRTLKVQYGDGVPNIAGAEDTVIAPNEKTRLLKLATESGRLIIRDRNDHQWTVKLRQVKTGEEEFFDAGVWGQRITTSLQVQVLSGPA